MRGTWRSSGVLILLLCHSSLAWTAPVDDARLRGVAWLLTQQQGDGRWRSTEGLDVQSTAAALQALTRAGVRGWSSAAGASWLSNTPTSSIDAQAQQILALRPSGMSVHPFLSRLVLQERNASLAWGT